MLTAIDMCCGAGGWATAARGLPIRFALAIDWWDAACMTHRINHPAVPVVRADLNHAPFRPESLRGRVDLVVGGIPCQWLSKYRNWSTTSRVRDDERVSGRRLVDSVLEQVARIRPRWFVLENVVGLIDELPPLTPYQVIDARHFSGQRRKRVYVGEFPAPRQAGDHRVLWDCLRPGPHRVGRRLFGRTPVLSSTFSRDTCLAGYPERKSPTICATESRRDSELGVVEGNRLRQMDWREGAIAQGWPEDYLFYGSASEVAQQVANSIQIDVGRAILTRIVEEWQGS